MAEDRKPPEIRSDGGGAHPPVLDMFVTKDDFFEYVLDNRDRQDANKKEVIAAVEASVASVTKRVETLEAGAKKQTVVVATVSSIGIIIATVVTSVVGWFSKIGGN